MPYLAVAEDSALFTLTANYPAIVQPAHAPSSTPYLSIISHDGELLHAKIAVCLSALDIS